MLASEAIAKALLDTHTDAEDYDPQTLWLKAYNIVRNKVINAIVKQKQDYFWDTIIFDLVVWQSEYNISYISWIPLLLIKNVKKAFIKYSDTDTYRKPITFLQSALMEEDPDYYSDNQPESQPFFNIKDKSVFIYPAPKNVVVWGWKMNVIYHPQELWYNDNDTIVDQDKQDIYAVWMAEHIYKSQGKINEANNAQAEFDKEIKSFITEIKSRYNAPVKKRFVNNLNQYR